MTLDLHRNKFFYAMKILSVSDIEIGFIYSPQITQRFRDVDLVIGCGDLPYYYLEYIISLLNVPLYFVRGNHASKVEYGSAGERTYPWGAINLHRSCVCGPGGILLAGVEGSIQYNLGLYQYSQSEMWWNVWSLVPSLLLNKLRFGRYLDIFVSHAPPWKIHDLDDQPHKGIKAFRWLIKVFKPTYHLHGHIHVYRRDTVTETLFGSTRVINSYGYRELEIFPAGQTDKLMHNEEKDTSGENSPDVSPSSILKS
jgi:Icc-related predicted phosphoesterase